MLISFYTRKNNNLAVTTKEQIGAKIKNARGDRTLAEIAKLTNNYLSVQRISNYEQGLRTPGIPEAKELAKALGNITAAELLGIDNESTLTPQERALLDNFRAADDRGKRTITNIAETQPAYKIKDKAKAG